MRQLEKRKRERNVTREGNIFTVSFYVLLEIIGLNKLAIFSTHVNAI